MGKDVKEADKICTFVILVIGANAMADYEEVIRYKKLFTRILIATIAGADL